MSIKQKQIDNILQDQNQLIKLIDKLFTDLLNQTQNLRKTNTVFDCKQVPSISVLEYLKRISKFANCSNNVFIVILIYIDRLQERIQNFVISKYNIHRLIITCIMVGSKFFDDFYFKNSHYAKIGGITMKQINKLEEQLINLLEFSLFIRQEQFNSYKNRVSCYIQINN